MNTAFALNVLGFASRLFTTIARNQGRNDPELAYLDLLGNTALLTGMTEDDLAELKAKYESEVANGTPVTAADLEAIAARIRARSERIQSNPAKEPETPPTDQPTG